MTRRTMLTSMLAGPLAASYAAPTAAWQKRDTTPPTAENLSATAQIQADHPRIMALAQTIANGAKSTRAAAMLTHDWVRDQIAFGIPPSFYESTATDVLDAKVGYCNTKLTLFSALLRAQKIPTRMRMMDLSAQVLGGLFNPGTPYVDHGLTEVFLGDQWVAVDSYVVDKRLAQAAAKRLSDPSGQVGERAQAKAGFGIHIDGQADWDGLGNNFIQCLDNGSIANYVLKDHGLFADVADFYQRTPAARNRITLLSGLFTRFGSSYINRQIDGVRLGQAV